MDADIPHLSSLIFFYKIINKNLENHLNQYNPEQRQKLALHLIVQRNKQIPLLFQLTFFKYFKVKPTCMQENSFFQNKERGFYLVYIKKKGAIGFVKFNGVLLLWCLW